MEGEKKDDKLSRITGSSSNGGEESKKKLALLMQNKEKNKISLSTDEKPVEKPVVEKIELSESVKGEVVEKPIPRRKKVDGGVESKEMTTMLVYKGTKEKIKEVAEFLGVTQISVLKAIIDEE